MRPARKRVGVAVAFALACGTLAAAEPIPASATTIADAQGCEKATDPIWYETSQKSNLPTLLQQEKSWALTRGAGVTVAIVDSGVNAADPRLAGTLVGGVDLVGGGRPNGGTDIYGHGTVIAGIIAAQASDANTGSQLVGLAPDVKLLSVRVFTNTDQQEIDNGRGASAPRVASGIRWAADHGAQIINVSLSTSYSAPELVDAVAYATARGSLVIASSGNINPATEPALGVEETDTTRPRLPAAAPGAIGVSALTSAGDGSETGVVNTGATVTGAHVSLAAPGQNVLSLSLNTGDCYYAREAPSTSFATAFVSAAAALVAAAHPDETPQQWAYRLEATALRGNADARSDESGWGIVQPYNAIIVDPGPGTRGPAENPFLPDGHVEATPTPDIISIAGADGHVEANMVRTTYIVVGTTGALTLAAVIGAYAAWRRRRRPAS